MSSKTQSLLLLLVAGVIACSPQPQPPSIDSPAKKVNVEACRNISLDFKTLQASGIRGLVSCLNGDNEALKPIKAFLDTLNDEDLNQLLQIYNLYVSTDPARFNRFLDIVEVMHQRGLLATLMTQIQVATETETAQKLLPLLSVIFETDAPRGFEKFVVQIIEGHLWNQNLLFAGHAFGGIHAKDVAKLLSSDFAGSIINSDGAVDLFSNEILANINDGSLHSLLTHMSDLPLQPANIMKLLSDEEVLRLSSLLSFLPQGSTHGSNRLERQRLNIVGADRPLMCFKSSSQARVAPNLLKFMAREAVKNNGEKEATHFFLQTLPLLLATTTEACDYSPDVINNIAVSQEIAQEGYASGYITIFKIILQSGRFEEIVRALKSPHVPAMGPLLEELGVRNVTGPSLQIFSQDISEEDSKTFALTLNLLTNGSLQGPALTAWIRNNVSASSGEVLLRELAKLESSRRNLANLSTAVASSPANDPVLRELKNAVAANSFNESFEKPVFDLASRLFNSDPQRRQELKDFSKALLKSWADPRGGLGDLFNVLTLSSGITPENPLQSLIHDALNDQELISHLRPIFLKMLKDPQFSQAVEFTGTLAGNGQLERVTVFLVELFRRVGGPSVQDPSAPKPILDNSSGTRKGPARSGPAARGPMPQYEKCLKVKGTLFDPQGENLYFALGCLNGNGEYPAFSKLAEELRASHLLSSFSGLLHANIISSPLAPSSLAELQTLFDSGSLGSLLKLFAIMGDESFKIPYLLDPILYDAFKHDAMPGTLKLIGKISQLDDLSAAGKTAVDLIQKEPRKFFNSNNNYSMKISQAQAGALKKHIKTLSDDNHWNWSAGQIESAYQVAAANFAGHNEAWRSEEGPYPRLSDAQWKTEIISFIQDLLRTGSLQEVVLALQDVADHMAPAQFLRRAIEDRRVVVHYSDEGVPRIHILTLLEQLEQLTVDADYHFPIAGHVGVSFQLAVVHADNLSSAMKQQHRLTKMGLTTANLTGKKREANHFRNMLASFDGLQEIADTHELKIFQRLYTAFYNATPKPDKEKKDVNANYMGTIFHVNKVGLFTNLAVGLSNAAEQGQLEKIVNAMMGVAKLIRPQDIEPLRQVLQALLTRARGGDTRPIDLFLTKLLAVEQNPRGYQELKDTLFHLVPAFDRLQVEPTALFKSLPALINQPKTWNDLADLFFSDGSLHNGNVFTIGSNLVSLSESGVAALRKIMNVVLSDNSPLGTSELPSVVALISDGYALRPADFTRLKEALNRYQKDPRVKALQPALLFKKILGEMEGRSGLGDQLGQLLGNGVQRQQFIKLGQVLAENGDFAPLFRIVIDQINSGGFDEALHFIFDNLGPASISSTTGSPRP